jgi:hypothetical protein
MCVRLLHASQRFVNLSMRNAIDTFGKKYTRWEAVFPGKFVSVSLFAPIAHLSPQNLLTCHLIYQLFQEAMEHIEELEVQANSLRKDLEKLRQQ